MAANYLTTESKGSHIYKYYSGTSGSNSFTLRNSSSHSKGVREKATYGSDTPNFNARKRRGELLPFTAFDQYEWDTDLGTSVFGYRSNAYTATSGKRVLYENTVITGPASVGVKHLANLVSYEGPLQSVAGQAAGWDVLTFAAEAHQLKSMVLGVLTKLSTLLRQRPPKFTVNQWLEFRYGWRVLYYDMQSIAEAFSALRVKRKFSKFTSGSSFTTTSTDNGVGNDGTLSYQGVTEMSNSFNIRARLVMVGEVRPIRVNPLVTAWELLRFSFVIDWFISIGKAIDALSLAMSGVRYVVGAGYRVDVEMKAHQFNVQLAAGYTMLEQTLGTSSGHGYCVSRSPASIPIRPLWNPSVTPGRLTDLIALILQRALR